MAERFDVVVAGGGPAGLASGIALAQEGLSVLVAEARELPVGRACGEGLLPPAVAQLHALGVARHLLPARRHPLRRVRYHAGEHEASAAIPGGPGWGVQREDLIDALLRRAAELPTLQLRDGCRVELGHLRPGDISLRAGGEAARARAVVGADGLGSPVRRRAGLPAWRPGRGDGRWGLSVHLEASPWPPEVGVHLGEGGEAYTTPTGRGVNLAFVLAPGRRALPAGEALLERLLLRFPTLPRRLVRARRLGPLQSRGPLRCEVPEVTRGDIFLAGDAAGYLDAATGEGVGLALGQAQLLGELLPPRLVAGEPAALAGPAYASAHAQLVRPHERVTRLVLALGRHPTLARWAVAGLRARPGLLRHLIAANMGRVPLWPVPSWPHAGPWAGN